MRLLIEMKIDDELAEKTGHTIKDFSELSEKMLKSYWFDEGVIFKNGEETGAEDSKAIINIYT